MPLKAASGVLCAMAYVLPIKGTACHQFESGTRYSSSHGGSVHSSWRRWSVPSLELDC